MIDKKAMVSAANALPGRSEKMPLPERHYVNGNSLHNGNGDINVPATYERALFGLGCFWGAERIFWQVEHVYLTATGYAAGFTPNPSYEEVCSGRTGHNEVVAVVFNPLQICYDDLLAIFWQAHNPTQGMQQGNDIGTQYRSGIYVYSDAQKTAAVRSKSRYQQQLVAAGYGEISTEIVAAPTFYFAEEYHQQYLAKNPAGYCGLGGIDIAY
jgi:peptide-methionine (S)-S-oxide reductase